MISNYLADVNSAELKKLAESYICLKDEPLRYEYRRCNISRLVSLCVPNALLREVQGALLHTLRDALQTHASEMGRLSDGLVRKNIGNR